MLSLLSQYLDFVWNNMIIGISFTMLMVFALVGIWQVAAAGWAKGKTLVSRFVAAYVALRAAAQADLTKAEAFALAPFATEMHVTAESIENIGIEVENRVRKVMGLAPVPLVALQPLSAPAAPTPVPVSAVGDAISASLPLSAVASMAAATVAASAAQLTTDPVTGSVLQSPAAAAAG